MRVFYGFLTGVITASGLLYFLLTPPSDSLLEEQVNRWRVRAFEAERILNSMRRDVARKEACECEHKAGLLDAEDAKDQGQKTENSGTVTADHDIKPATTDFEDESISLDDDKQWEMLITGALETGVQRLGVTISPPQRLRLLSALNKMRDISLSIDETRDPNDPDQLRQRLQKTTTLLEVDRLFRDELGVSVSEFVESIGSNEIEEIDVENLTEKANNFP